MSIVETTPTQSRPVLPARLPIPATLNLLLLVLAVVVNAALLFGASHASTWWAVAACVVTFSYTANTAFSLLHESVHGLLHPNRQINEWGGRIAAIFFPTSLSIQRGYHLTHHRNNRTELERFDYLQAGESMWLKRAQWYGILTGLYWLVSVTGLLVYLLLPKALTTALLRRDDSTLAHQTAARTYLAALDSVNPVTARLEILFSIAVQVTLFVALDLSATGWLLCYAAFALQWSALQYADHAYSPLDTHNGAWDLRVNAAIRALFLNYHFHLAHHRHPSVPWLYLGRFVENDKPQPRYLSMWLSMWRGPRRLGADAAQ